VVSSASLSEELMNSKDVNGSKRKMPRMKHVLQTDNIIIVLVDDRPLLCDLRTAATRNAYTNDPTISRKLAQRELRRRREETTMK
jgi:hypothetical protein